MYPLSTTRVLAIARYLRVPCSSNRPDHPPSSSRNLVELLRKLSRQEMTLFQLIHPYPRSESSSTLTQDLRRINRAISETAQQIAEQHHVGREGLRLTSGPRTFWDQLSGSVWPLCNRVQGGWGMRLNTQGFPFHRRYARRHGSHGATTQSCLLIDDLYLSWLGWSRAEFRDGDSKTRRDSPHPGSFGFSWTSATHQGTNKNIVQKRLWQFDQKQVNSIPESHRYNPYAK